MGKREFNFEPTRIERLLANVLPGVAQRLHRGRLRFEMQAAFGRGVGGYVGARRDRAATAEWAPGGGSPSADQVPDLPMLRDRSRDQMRNAPVALGALNTDCLHVVGTGLTMTPALNFKLLGISADRAAEWTTDTKVRFNLWAKSTDCDWMRQQDFYSQTDLVYRSWEESGDVFVLTPIETRGGDEILVLQIHEADRVSTPLGKRDNEYMQDGIELKQDTYEPIAVHISRFHPGDQYRTGNSWTRVPIRGENTDRLNVIHILDIVRPGQVRGVPWIAPILEPLKQLGKWSDAELNAAVVSSLWVVFMEMDADAFGDLFDETSQTRVINDAQKWSGKIESGKAVNLLPGEKAEMKTPGRPNPEFDPFFQAMSAQLGIALGVPKEVLLMQFQSSYSAARAAFMMAARRWSTRRDKIAKVFCQPVYELWLTQEVAAGRIACPGFFASKTIRAAWCEATWTGDGFGSIDPVKDTQAASMRVDMGISTLQDESVRYDGRDWDTKQSQRAKEVQRQRADGTLPTPGAQKNPVFGPPEDGVDENGDPIVPDDKPAAKPRPMPPAPPPQQRRIPA